MRRAGSAAAAALRAARVVAPADAVGAFGRPW
jgi:hypothetical protein